MRPSDEQSLSLAAAAARVHEHPHFGRACNLYQDFDFHRVAAFAMQGPDKLLVAEVFDNVRGRDWGAFQSQPWIVIGKPHSASGGSIQMQAAITLSPYQLANIFRASNYAPIDCFRGLYADVSRLSPELQRDVTIPFAEISEEFSLGPTAWTNVYRELGTEDLLSSVLKSRETTRRFECAAQETAHHLQECLFTTYRMPLYHDTAHEFLHTMVQRGEVSSPDPTSRWRLLRRDSRITTTLDVAEKYGAPDAEALESLARTDEQLRQELESARANEWEILQKNVSQIFPGAFKGSIIEQLNGAGPGCYRFMVTHSHPIVDPGGHIEPSTLDLRALLDLRLQHAAIGGEGFGRRERVMHCPIFTIIQPADWEGERYFGLVLKEQADAPVGRELGVTSDDELGDLISTKGLTGALAELGIESHMVRGRRGRGCTVMGRK